MDVSDSSPRASMVVCVRNPQRLTLADGTLFPPGCCAIPWGRASGPADLAPEALEECVYSFRVFPQRPSLCEVLGSADINDVSASAVPCARIDTCLCSVHIQEVQPCVEPPRLGPFEAIGACSPSCSYAPSSSFRGTGG
jgi:hypothetical protein